MRSIIFSAFLAASTAFAGVAAAQEAPGLAAITDPAEKTRVQALVDNAEDKLTMFGVYVEPVMLNNIIEEFKRWYGIDRLDVEYTYGDSGAAVTRINALLDSNTNDVDIVWSVLWDWYKDLIDRGEVMEYDSPYYEEYTLSDAAGMSKRPYYVADSYTFIPTYNVEELARHGITDWEPDSWDDFTDPRLRGLISMSDLMTSTTNVPNMAGVLKVMGDSWLETFATNTDPVLFNRGAQGRDWMASGEFPVTLMGNIKDAFALKEAGLEIRQIHPKEGISLIPFMPIILTQAPHPNVSKLFIDFVRSAHGAQTVMDSGVLMFYGRPGVVSPDPNLLPAWEDVNVIDFDWDTEAGPDMVARIRGEFSRLGMGR